MKDNLHYIDKLFKAAIDDHGEAPSAGVWEAIDHHLDKKNVDDIYRKYNRLKRIAIALLALLLGAAVYSIYNWKTAKEEAMLNNNKNRETHNPATVLKSSQNIPDKTITSVTGNAVKNELIERSDKISLRQQQNKKEPGIPTDHAANTAVVNLTGSTGQITTPGVNTTTAGKIFINKKTQKTIITNADYGEVENETVNPVINNKENELAQNNLSLPLINAEILRVQPVGTFKNSILSGSNILPNNLTLFTMPGKTKRIRKAASFAATVFYAPDISFNHIKDDEHERRPGRPFDNKDKMKKEEHHQFSSSFGLLLDYSMNKHWSLQSGFALSDKTIRINPKTIYATHDNNGAIKYLYNCSSGYTFLSSKTVTNPAVGDSLNAHEATNILQYVSIPLALKYTYSLKRVDLFASVGTSVNILTKGQIRVEIENGNNKEVSITNKMDGLKPGYFGGNMSMGAAYNITDKIAISFMPAYNFAITSSIKNSTVKTYPNSVSWATGIRFRL
jgi:hypothetical protein